MKKISLFAVLIIPAIAIAFAGNNKKNNSATETIPPVITDTFIYHFGDASVAPNYHRSYTITVTPKMAKLTIESYSDVLKRESVKLTAEQFKNFKKSLEALHITHTEQPASNGCTGGTSKSLRLYAGTNKEINGSMYYCGGKAEGSLSGDVDAAALLFTKLINDLNKKIAATRKQ